MFSSDKNVEAIRQLFDDGREYLELKGHDVRLSLTEKLSVAASAFILGGVLLLLGCIVVAFLAAMFALFVSKYVGLTIACAITAALLSLLGVVCYAKRKAWIVNPVTRFFAGLILDAKSEK